MRDDWTWTAIYSDGTELTEHDEQGNARGWAMIDHARLRKFVLLHRDGVRAELPVHEGYRPIFFRRRLQSPDPFARRMVSEPFLTVIGWQQTLRVVVEEDGLTRVEERNFKTFCALTEDGRIILSPDDNEINT